jgi:hypothetical protein
MNASSAQAFNQEPYYLNAKLKVRTFATSGNWVDTNCGSNNSATTFGTNGNDTAERPRLDAQTCAATRHELQGRCAMNPILPTALIAHFGSLRTTLALMGCWAGGLLRPDARVGWRVVRSRCWPSTCWPRWWCTRLRRQLPLLVFHLALLALVLLAGAGRLLAGRPLRAAQGVDRSTAVLIAPGRRLAPRRRWRRWRSATRASRSTTRPAANAAPRATRVTLDTGRRPPRSAVIGDHRPLQVDGYRIYTSPNKGFAPVLRWTPPQGEPVSRRRAPAQLSDARAAPVARMDAARRPRVWVMLQIDETLIDPDASSAFRVPERHRLVLRMDDDAHRTAARPERADRRRHAHLRGPAHLDGLPRQPYDPTLPWLLAAALLAALSLAWHYAALLLSAPEWPAALRRAARCMERADA